MKLARSEFPKLVALVILCAGSRTAFALAPATAPTTQEIQNDFDAKQYRDAIKKTVAALAMKTDVYSIDDQIALHALKAESHLQLRQYVLAADTFEAAAKQASDPDDAIKFKATSILIRKSPTGQYQPRPPIVAGAARPAPIDVLDVITRGAALGSLFEDQRKMMEDKVAALQKQTDLTAMLDAVKQTNDLGVLETSVENKNEATKQLTLSLAHRANGVMSIIVNALIAKTDDLNGRANQKIRIMSRDTGLLLSEARRGLHNDEKDMLRNIIATAVYIRAKCEDFTRATDIDAKGFDLNKKRATNVAKHADEVLNTNYGAS